MKRPKGDPTKTFKRGVFVAFAIVSVLYLLANIAYVGLGIEDARRELADISSLPP